MHHSNSTGKATSGYRILKKLSGTGLAIFDSGFAVLDMKETRCLA